MFDLVICNDSNRICSIVVIEPLGTSGQSTIGFDVHWQIKRGSSKSRILEFMCKQPESDVDD